VANRLLNLILKSYRRLLNNFNPAVRLEYQLQRIKAFSSDLPTSCPKIWKKICPLFLFVRTPANQNILQMRTKSNKDERESQGSISLILKQSNSSCAKCFQILRKVLGLTSKLVARVYNSCSNLENLWTSIDFFNYDYLTICTIMGIPLTWGSFYLN